MNAGKIATVAILLLSFFVLSDIAAAKYSGGSGTAGDPYKIGTANDLFALAANTGDYDANFVLIADINLASDPCKSAIIAPDTNSANGTFDGNAFTGVFDGNNYTISNLTINTGGSKGTYLGLFGQTGSTSEIKNLGLKNVNITGGDNSLCLGGLVGKNNGGTISNCNSEGSVSCGNSSYYLGGLVGVAGNGTISNCYSIATVTGQSGSWYLGGLAGVNNNSISNCYSTGTVSSGHSSQYVGGLVGYNNFSISYCYSIGDVNGASGVGGLLGGNSGTISSCYFLDSEPNNDLGTPLSDPNMKKQSSYSGWDFVDVWRIREGIGYPKLQTGGYSGGKGMADEPYLIADVNDLLEMAAKTYNYDAYFILIADINLAAESCTGAIIAPDTSEADGNFNGTVFTGAFDGNNHTISNLTINTLGAGNDYLGLFGKIDPGSDIKNLSLKNVSITGGDNSSFLGGLVGDSNYGTIDNCHTNGNITGGTSLWCVGGLAGMDNSGNISNSNSACKVSGEGYSECLGGLVGFKLGGGTISNCFATGNVSNKSDSDYMDALGGLVGEADGGTISDCWAAGNVTGGNDGSYDLGGLMGGNWGHIINCFSIGTVSGGDDSTYFGGLTGRNAGSVSGCWSSSKVNGGNGCYYFGGLTADKEGSTASDCYSTGTVTCGDDSNGIGGLAGINDWSSTISNCYSVSHIVGGDDEIGGLVGDNNATVTSCYFLNTEPNNNAGTALTAAKMKQRASFGDEWDFNDTWWISEKAGYPKLDWQIDATKCSVTAGSDPNKDKISFSGAFNADDIDFNDANANNTIRVSIWSDDLVNSCDINFPVNANTFKKGKYNYSGTDANGVKKSFTYDTKTRKFAFSASNVNLVGFYCPAITRIDINDCNRIAPLDEPLVNGTKAPAPIKLMTGVKNTLWVDKCTVKQNTTSNKDQLTASGGFAVENPDVNMADCNLVVTLDEQHFTIPAHSLKAGKGMFSCSNIKITDPNATATASFKFSSCAFTLTIKDTNIPNIHGVVDFGVAFADFNEVQQVTIP